MAAKQKRLTSDKGISFLAGAGTYVLFTVGAHLSGIPAEVVKEAAPALGVIAAGIFWKRDSWKKGKHVDRP